MNPLVKISRKALISAAFFAGILFPIIRAAIYKYSNTNSVFLFVCTTFFLGIFTIWFFQCLLLSRKFSDLMPQAGDKLHSVSLGIVISMIFSLSWIILTHLLGFEVISGFASAKFISLASTISYISLVLINSVLIAIVLSLIYQGFVFKTLSETSNWYSAVLYTALFYALGAGTADIIVLPQLPPIILIGSALLAFFIMVLATFSFQKKPTIWVPFGIFFAYNITFNLRDGIFFVQHNQIIYSLVLAYGLVLLTLAFSRALFAFDTEPKKTKPKQKKSKPRAGRNSKKVIKSKKRVSKKTISK